MKTFLSLDLKRGVVNLHPVQLPINYWEPRPSAVGAKLDELLRLGVHHVATFVPWQAAESDISHTLTRFLQAVSDRRMTVSLILSPEVGIHYPNSGLPKDVISREANMAKHCHSGPVLVNLPPNAYSLPSFFAPEFAKRYYSFLSRMDSLFADLARQPGSPLKNVNIVL